MSKVKIICGKCAKPFKEHHSKIRNGTSVSCPACGQKIDFDSRSADLNVRRALSAARQFRLSSNAGIDAAPAV